MNAVRRKGGPPKAENLPGSLGVHLIYLTDADWWALIEEGRRTQAMEDYLRTHVALVERFPGPMGRRLRNREAAYLCP